MAARAAHTKPMGESTRLGKNRRTAQSQKETRERRKNKDILVRTVKIQRNKLSRAQMEALERLFLEGKWLYNTALAHGQFDEEPRRSLDNTVEVKLPTGEIERRQLTVLGGQMRQGILARMRDNLKGLKPLKDRGRKIGGLRFISEIASIPLKQCGTCFPLAAPDNIKINGYGTQLNSCGDECQTKSRTGVAFRLFAVRRRIRKR